MQENLAGLAGRPAVPAARPINARAIHGESTKTTGPLRGSQRCDWKPCTVPSTTAWPTSPSASILWYGGGRRGAVAASSLGGVILFTRFIDMLFHPGRRPRRANQHPVPCHGQRRAHLSGAWTGTKPSTSPSNPVRAAGRVYSGRVDLSKPELCATSLDVPVLQGRLLRDCPRRTSSPSSARRVPARAR